MRGRRRSLVPEPFECRSSWFSHLLRKYHRQNRDSDDDAALSVTDMQRPSCDFTRGVKQYRRLARLEPECIVED